MYRKSRNKPPVAYFAKIFSHGCLFEEMPYSKVGAYVRTNGNSTISLVKMENVQVVTYQTNLYMAQITGLKLRIQDSEKAKAMLKIKKLKNNYLFSRRLLVRA